MVKTEARASPGWPCRSSGARVRRAIAREDRCARGELFGDTRERPSDHANRRRVNEEPLAGTVMLGDVGAQRDDDGNGFFECERVPGGAPSFHFGAQASWRESSGPSEAA